MLLRRLLAALLLLPVSSLQGCTMAYQLFVRNLGAEAVTLRLYPKRRLTLTGHSLPMIQQVLKPRFRILRQLTDSVMVQQQGKEVSLTLPPRSTTLLGFSQNAFPVVDSVRLERTGQPAQLLDSTMLAMHYGTHLKLLGGQVWLDLP